MITKPLFYLLPLLLWGCGQAGSPEADSHSSEEAVRTYSDADLAAAGISLDTLRIHTFQDSLHLTGTVDVLPQRRSQASVPITARVRQVWVQEGQYVTAGQPLAELESMEYVQLQQDYLTAVAEMRFLEQEVARQNLLAQENAGARRNAEEAARNHAKGRATLDALAARLRLVGTDPSSLTGTGILPTLALRAPTAGRVQHVALSTGSTLQALQPAFDIVDEAGSILHLQALPQDVTRLALGAAIRVRLPDGKSCAGRISSVSNSTESSSNFVSVLAHVAQPCAPLVQGMYVQAVVPSASPRQAHALLREAIQGTPEAPIVWVRQGSSFRAQRVSLGLQEGEWAEVLSPGTLLGQRVATQGAALLSP
jgi:cobalt-zinc-cadmium efflux system membrane fusion protein